jgi:PLP dependent protein
MSIRNKISALESVIQQYKNCKLIAVTKTKPVSEIMEAYQAGLKRFGENKVQEMAEKHAQLPQDIEWHMIGHLQRNKVKFIAPFVCLIHSVDSERLLEEVNKQAGKVGRIIPCLLQVHIAEEETKFGFSEEELKEFIASGRLGNYANIAIKGLMGMATFTEDEKLIRREFKNLKRLFDEIASLSQSKNLSMEELSMGMSGDYEIAIQEGSTMIRVGSAIFGERNYN